jgi:hypothetical protein
MRCTYWPIATTGSDCCGGSSPRVDHFRQSYRAREGGCRLRAVPAAPALRPVAGVELAGRLARRGVAKND